MVQDTGGWNLNYLTFTNAMTASGTPQSLQPFTGTAQTIANMGATTVEVEKYDLGGSGVAFNLSNHANAGVYRKDGFDLEAANDVGNGYDLGYTAPGNWTGYTVNVTTAGSYIVTARVASASTGGTFHLEIGPVGQIGGTGTTKMAAFTVPSTGGWQNWTSLVQTGVKLPAGKQWIRLVQDSAGWNVNYLTFAFSSADTGTVSTGTGPTYNLAWSRRV